MDSNKNSDDSKDQNLNSNTSGQNGNTSSPPPSSTPSEPLRRSSVTDPSGGLPPNSPTDPDVKTDSPSTPPPPPKPVPPPKPLPTTPKEKPSQDMGVGSPNIGVEDDTKTPKGKDDSNFTPVDPPKTPPKPAIPPSGDEPLDKPSTPSPSNDEPKDIPIDKPMPPSGASSPPPPIPPNSPGGPEPSPEPPPKTPPPTENSSKSNIPPLNDDVSSSSPLKKDDQDVSDPNESKIEVELSKQPLNVKHYNEEAPQKPASPRPSGAEQAGGPTPPVGGSIKIPAKSGTPVGETPSPPAQPGQPSNQPPPTGSQPPAAGTPQPPFAKRPSPAVAPAATPAPPTKAPNTGAILTVLAILAIVLGSAGGFYGFRYYDNLKITATTNGSPSPEITITETPSLDVNLWSTYASTKYSYSLKYPNEWAASTTDAQADELVFASNEESLTGVPTGFKIDINFQDLSDKDLETWVEDNSVIVSEENPAKEVTVSGTTAYQQELTQNGPQVATYIEVGSMVMIVTYSAPSDTFGEGGDWYNTLISSIQLE